MSSRVIQSILHEIESLADDERLELERELSRRLDAEWDEAVAGARVEAKRRGIDQAAIDQAIARRRYGGQ
jgi:hypothetical protein